MKTVYHFLLNFIFLISFSDVILYGQSILSLSVFNHATALPPQNFSGQIHPGIDIGFTTRNGSLNAKSGFINWKTGYYYHRLVHHGIQLYGEYNKIYPVIKNKVMLGWSGGLGYLHTIELHEKFTLKSDGNYTRTGKLGKPHAQASLAAKIIVSGKSISPYLEYRLRLSTPFVNNYVPLLPSTSLHLGIYYIIETFKSIKA